MIYEVECHYWHSRASFSKYYITEAADETDAIAQVTEYEGPNPRTTHVEINAWPLDLSRPAYLYETD